MHIDDPASTKQYLISSLESLTDADPEVLADYVMALVRAERPLEELQSSCVEQLYDFLGNNTNVFVEQLFQRLACTPTSTAAVASKGASHATERLDRKAHAAARHGSRSKSPTAERLSSSGSSVSAGLARRGSSDSDQSNDVDFRRRSHRSDHQRLSSRVEVRGGQSYRPTRNDTSAYERSRDDHSRPSADRSFAREPKKCWDYEQRGFCTRGDTCQFEHGSERIVVGDRSQRPSFEPRDRRDPHNSRDSRFGSRPVSNFSRSGTLRGARSDTKLIIANIPYEHCTISQVHDFFKRHGTILNVTVSPAERNARIQYMKHEEAAKAYSSPDVIFDNRFVKVFWDKDDGTTPSGIVPPLSIPANAQTKTPDNVPTRAVSADNGATWATNYPAPSAATAAAIKKQEALKTIFEIQRQKQDLLNRNLEQQKALITRLADKNLNETERTSILSSIRSLDEAMQALTASLSKSSILASSTNAPTESSEPADPLVNQLERLQADAEKIGVTVPSARPAAASSHPLPPAPVLRGGPAALRGRGRGGYASVSAKRAFRLDLRPTAMTLRPIPARLGRDIGSLRKFFEPFGEIKGLLLLPDESGALIQYTARQSAEKAMHYVPKSDLGEPFEFAWYEPNKSTSHAESNSIKVFGADGKEEQTHETVADVDVDVGAENEGEDLEIPIEKSWKH